MDTRLMDAFITLLEEQNIVHTVIGAKEAICIPGNLDLDLGDSGITELPEGIVVEGFLNLDGTELRQLPNRLVVKGALLLNNTSIPELPLDLVVLGSFSLGYSAITTLREGFCVKGGLYLTSTMIKELPEGLHVAGNLDLRDTKILDFPEKMFVGGTIFPPNGLLDIQAFMRTQVGVVSFTAGGTRHGMMQLMQQLQEFPDLRRVVASLGLNGTLRIVGNATVGYITHCITA